MRRIAKVDANQNEIVKALRAVNASVQPIHTVGGGTPDLLVGFRQKNFLLEVKDGSLSPSRKRLTPDEQTWHDGWQGQVVIVESVEQALAAIGATNGA